MEINIETCSEKRNNLIDTIDKLIDIHNTDSSYLEKLAEGWNGTKAWNHALGNNFPKVVKANNPNFDWSPFYTDELL